MTDISLATYLTALQQTTVSTMASVIGHLWTTTYGVLSGLTINEATNGPLNAICVSWDRTEFDAHISDLTFQTFAS